MNTSRSRRLRLPVVLICNLMVFGIMLACCNPGNTTSTPAGIQIRICAVNSTRARDFPNDACGTGTFVGLHGKANLQLQALDKNGHPMAHTQLTLTIHGVNASTATLTTDGNGLADFSYLGTHLGSDTVSVRPTSGGVNTAKPNAAVVHWIPTGGTLHPLIWVHGIHEDATDFAHELQGTPDPDQASDASEQTWSSLIGALTTTYNPNAMQAFCYVDDIAWTHVPSGCPNSESRQCSNSTDCLSQSSVYANAVALATVVQKLSQQFSNKQVTLIAYSMGGAVVRTMLAGCPSLGIDGTVQLACQPAAGFVNHVFLLNAAQEGSWLLTAKRGLDPSTLSEAGVPALSAFAPVLPLIESFLFDRLKDQLGLDLNAAAETDLTPQSQNIVLQNSMPPQSGPDIYSFYGDIQLGLETNYLIYTTPAQTLLPLGDLVMLPQDDSATATPLWGGAALCDGCPPLANGQTFHQNGRYYEWALTDKITIQMNGLVPLLSAPDAASALQAVLDSPVQHLNISQPTSQDPGSTLQVKDITGQAGGSTTDMSDEIYLIIAHGDGLE